MGAWAVRGGDRPVGNTGMSAQMEGTHLMTLLFW